MGLLAEAVKQVAHGVLLDEEGGGVEGVEAGVPQGGGDGTHVFDVDTVDLGDLLDQQVEEVLRRQLDDQLVDGAARAALEDVDSDHVATHGADAAGHRAQGAGPVREPHADDVGEHGWHGRGPV